MPIRALSSFCPVCHDAESENDTGCNRDCDRTSGHTSLPMCTQGHVCCHRVSGGGGSDLSIRHRVEPGNFNSPRAPVRVQLRKALLCSCMVTVVQHCGSPAAAAVIVQTRAKRSITLHFPRACSLLKALQQWDKKFKKTPQEKACFCHKIKINK